MRLIVIDANIGISLVVPLSYSPWTIQRIEEWRQIRARIVVPALWRYEVLSGLRKAMSAGLLSEERARLSIGQLGALAFEELALSWKASALVLDWAGRIGQVVAYDAVYLALAEQLGAELWTADRRLVQAAHRAGASWVYPVMQGEVN